MFRWPKEQRQSFLRILAGFALPAALIFMFALLVVPAAAQSTGNSTRLNASGVQVNAPLDTETSTSTSTPTATATRTPTNTPTATPTPCIDATIIATRDAGGHVQVTVIVTSTSPILGITGDVFCTGNCGVPSEDLTYTLVGPNTFRSNCSVNSYPSGGTTKGNVTIRTSACTSTFRWSGTVAGTCLAPTNTPTNTRTFTPTNTPTNTRTFTPTNTPTNSPTPTFTPTNTPTFTATNSPTRTPTNTPTNSPTNTTGPTVTGTIPATFTATNSPTRTPTNTPTYTPTSTRIPSSTPTSTPTNTPTFTATNSPTITPTNTPTSTACLSSEPIIGSISETDGLQVGRLNRDGVPSECGVSKGCPMQIDSLGRRYDAYTFRNTTGSNACFTATLDAGSCVESRFLFSAVYRDSFNPSNLCQNYIADIGASPNPRGSYSFNVPAGATFVVVVQAIDPSATCDAYALTVSNCSCTISFSDVHPADYFYTPVHGLYCRNAISGYSDGTFRPYNNTTRSQLSKIVVLAFNYPEYRPARPTFSDVDPTNPFYAYIETAVHNNIVSGYSDGTFRPFANVTRGQLSKIVVIAAGWPTINPPNPRFTDVPREHPFYTYIETAYSHQIISGYADGSFRPYSDATRGQISKIVYNAILNR